MPSREWERPHWSTKQGEARPPPEETEPPPDYGWISNWRVDRGAEEGGGEGGREGWEREKGGSLQEESLGLPVLRTRWRIRLTGRGGVPGIAAWLACCLPIVVLMALSRWFPCSGCRYS